MKQTFFYEVSWRKEFRVPTSKDGINVVSTVQPNKNQDRSPESVTDEAREEGAFAKPTLRPDLYESHTHRILDDHKASTGPEFFWDTVSLSYESSAFHTTLSSMAWTGCHRATEKATAIHSLVLKV